MSALKTEPAAKQTMLGDWLRGGVPEETRKASFEYASFTHGVIHCFVIQIRPTSIRSATGAGNIEGDAFIVALQKLEASGWARR